jgi:hypothetical protein
MLWLPVYVVAWALAGWWAVAAVFVAHWGWNIRTGETK